MNKKLQPPFVPQLDHKADVKYISEQFLNAKMYSDDNSSINSRQQINVDGFSYCNGGFSPRSQFSEGKHILTTNQIIEKCRKFNNSHAQLKSLAKPEFEVQSKSQLNSPKQNDIDSEFFMEELPFVKVIPLEQELQQEKKKSLFAHL
eukprot:TRINITY_DN9859_c0_g1_i1.p1 TRINITY_DN9859_c0_g1~~TRINITY_DN9859_c0_g1_i1.p1  ORF type:complete len:147 (-),score=23.11 TRINITY_DN9859_c0_g1_i1:54-494(-)